MPYPSRRAALICPECGEEFSVPQSQAHRRERVAVEFDGDYWHDLPQTAAKDQRKNAALGEEGSVVRIRQSEHEADPGLSLTRIAAARGIPQEVQA